MHDFLKLAFHDVQEPRQKPSNTSTFQQNQERLEARDSDMQSESKKNILFQPTLNAMGAAFLRSRNEAREPLVSGDPAKNFPGAGGSAFTGTCGCGSSGWKHVEDLFIPMGAIDSLHSTWDIARWRAPFDLPLDHLDLSEVRKGSHWKRIQYPGVTLRRGATHGG